MNGKLIVLASPSGGGKTTIIKHLLARHKNAVHSISCTTRPIRVGEVNGGDYHHIDEKTFRDGIANDQFAEWNEVHNCLYGTPKEPIEKWLSEGKIVLLDLDVIGGLKLCDLYRGRSLSIFVMPPSEEVLKTRLIGRKTDSPEVQALRLKNAIAELSYKDKFDHIIINDDLEKAVAEAERMIGLKL